MEMALESFEQFARRSRTSLRLSAAAMCGEWHAADDLVQEALVILYRHWDDIEPPARAAYARTVMSHLVTHQCALPCRRRRSWPPPPVRAECQHPRRGSDDRPRRDFAATPEGSRCRINPLL
jgi:DNA-directed RNA polymerase specialized sigma24 family protein